AVSGHDRHGLRDRHDHAGGCPAPAPPHPRLAPVADRGGRPCRADRPAIGACPAHPRVLAVALEQPALRRRPPCSAPFIVWSSPASAPSCRSATPPPSSGPAS